MTQKTNLCVNCGCNSFILNDALYPKCINCGNYLTDRLEIEVVNGGLIIKAII